MPPNRRSARDVILARRALFVASALHGVTAHAQGSQAQAVPAGDASAPQPTDEDDPSKRPPLAYPMPCLSPPPPTTRSDHDAIDLVLDVEPSLLVPLYQPHVPLGFGTRIDAGLRRGLGSTLDVALVVTTMPTHARHDFLPLGGTLRLGYTGWTPREWDSEYRLGTTLEVGGGFSFVPASSGTSEQAWIPTRGPWLSLGTELLGFRYRDYRGETGFSVGVPIAVVFTDQRSSKDERFAPTYFTFGLRGTFSFELKKSTHTSFD